MVNGGPSLLELLLVHLTREEFKLIFGLLFLADGSEYEDALQFDQYASPGWEEHQDKWPEWIRKAIRYLTFEHGYEFEFLIVLDNGSIHRKGDLIEPGNVHYLTGLAYNQVDYRDALRVVIEHIHRGEIALPIEMFREAVSSMDDTLDYQERHADHEKIQRFDKMRDEMLASAGVVRRERVH